jgi:segregation and condensation protein A
MSEYRVQFEVFEGPLDLLLHLVKKQEVDIYQVSLTKIATEFVAYLEKMRELDLEVAGEFLVMAATLLYIKSRELLPVEQQVKPEAEEEEGDDPRWELIRRLVEYKKFKEAAFQLEAQEERRADMYERRPARPEFVAEVEAKRTEVSVFDLINAVSQVLKRFKARDDLREIDADPYTVSEKMDSLRELILTRRTLKFGELFTAARSRLEVVVTFLAMLELTRLRQIVLTQPDDFGEIEVAVLQTASVAPVVPPVEDADQPSLFPEAVPIAAAADRPQDA